MAEPPAAPRGRPRLRPPSRYSIVVGLAFAAIVVLVTVEALGGGGDGLLGAGERERGRPLAQFAVPRVLGPLDGDANVFQDDCGTAELPCPSGARRTPACEVDVAGALRVCDFFDRPLVLSFWFSTPSGCPPTQEAVSRLAERYEDRIRVLSVAVRGDRGELRRIVSEGGWSMPVGWDRDGAVSNVYGVGVCPTLVYAYPGGVLHEAEVYGSGVAVSELASDVEDLIRASRSRAGASR